MTYNTIKMELRNAMTATTKHLGLLGMALEFELLFASLLGFP